MTASLSVSSSRGSSQVVKSSIPCPSIPYKADRVSQFVGRYQSPSLEVTYFLELLGLLSRKRDLDVAAESGLTGETQASSFSKVIQPTPRLKPNFVLTANIGALLDAFQVFTFSYPFCLAKSTTFSFSATAIPLPRYSRLTPVFPWTRPLGSRSRRQTVLNPTYLAPSFAIIYASGKRLGFLSSNASHCSYEIGVKGAVLGMSAEISWTSSWRLFSESGPFLRSSARFVIVIPCRNTFSVVAGNLTKYI